MWRTCEESGYQNFSINTIEQQKKNVPHWSTVKHFSKKLNKKTRQDSGCCLNGLHRLPETTKCRADLVPLCAKVNLLSCPVRRFETHRSFPETYASTSLFVGHSLGSSRAFRQEVTASWALVGWFWNAKFETDEACCGNLNTKIHWLVLSQKVTGFKWWSYPEPVFAQRIFAIEQTVASRKN